MVLNRFLVAESPILSWFKSNVTERTSEPGPLLFLSVGVPQGSIQGPVFFSFDMLPLRFIFRKYNIPFFQKRRGEKKTSQPFTEMCNVG